MCPLFRSISRADLKLLRNGSEQLLLFLWVHLQFTGGVNGAEIPPTHYYLMQLRLRCREHQRTISPTSDTVSLSLSFTTEMKITGLI